VAPLVAPLPLVPVVGTAEGAVVGVDTGEETAEPPGVVVPPPLGAEVVGVGGAAGVAGVPKVEGVHAHTRLAPTTVARLAKIATEMNRVCLRT